MTQSDHNIARCILCGNWMMMPKQTLRNADYMPICSPCLQTQLELTEHINSVKTL